MAKTNRSLLASAFLIIIFGLFSAGVASAQQEEYKDYTVSKGDTLWDISSKEITDPFLWPKIWKENPEIKNPDLIYPGQRVRIPLYLLRKEIQPAPEQAMPEEVKPPLKPERKEEAARVIQPVKKTYLVDRDTFTSSGYIVDAVDVRGQIIGAPSEKALLGKDDYVYIESAGPVKKGDKFYVIRPPRKIHHPQTGRMLGYVVEIVAVAQVVGEETGHTKTKLTSSFVDVYEGYPLIDYYETELPISIDEPRTPDVNGFIVGSKESRISIIVYIDKGRKDGIEVGDAMGIISRGRFDVPNGHLQVIKTQEATSTAVIRKYSKEIEAGDLITKLTPPVE